MRRVRFIDRSGRPSSGIWTDDGIESGGRVYDEESVRILPPTEPSKIIGVGPNYESNVAEKDRERPQSPGGTATFEGTGEYCFELELGVVIGDRCRNVAAEQAHEVVAGYTCVNEITDLSPPDSLYDPSNLIRAKAIDDCAPIGPVVASPELVPADASMDLRVNGDVRQQTERSNCVFSESEVIEEVSSYLTLEPGDVIATGSGTGVAALADGDHVAIRIEGIGTLEHDVSIAGE